MSQAPQRRRFLSRVLLLLVLVVVGGANNPTLAGERGAVGPAAGGSGALDRLGYSVEGAESSHGADARMWRPDPNGPQGPMQVSAAAAADVGGGDRFDEAQNRALGRAYLADMYHRYGSWPDALAAYNWGPGHMTGWIGSGRPADKLPPAVARYQTRVLVTAGLPIDGPDAGVGRPANARLSRLAMLRSLAKREMAARRRSSIGSDEVALLYTELMRVTSTAAR
jgi:Transglycosylase SLT domain